MTSVPARAPHEQLRGMQVLVTGANGFVGRALCDLLDEAGARVRRLVRTASGREGEVVVADPLGWKRWDEVLDGVGVVVHLAARVHVMRDRATDPAWEFNQVNCELTRQLARASAQCGVRRFVFLSSIKVNGEGRAMPYAEMDLPAPEDDYGRSKRDAEAALLEIGSNDALQAVVLRPPLVYGPQVRGNFLRLLHAIHAGYPMPLGGVRNRRSLIYLGNLVDAIALAMCHPVAAGVFLVRDGEDLSTAELIRRLAHHMGVAARLLPLPVGAIRLAANMLGRGAAANRLVGSLCVDDSRVRGVLGWRPPFTVDAGLEATVRWYLSVHAGR